MEFFKINSLFDNFIHVCHQFWLPSSPYHHLHSSSTQCSLSSLHQVHSLFTSFCCFCCCVCLFVLHWIFFFFFFLLWMLQVSFHWKLFKRRFLFYSHWFWRARWLSSGCRVKWPPGNENIKTVCGKWGFYRCYSCVWFPQMDFFSSLISCCCGSSAPGIFR